MDTQEINPKKKKKNTLPRSGAPDGTTDLSWIFLHTVLAVGVQFLTTSSCLSHLLQTHNRGALSMTHSD